MGLDFFHGHLKTLTDSVLGFFISLTLSDWIAIFWILLCTLQFFHNWYFKKKILEELKEGKINKKLWKAINKL